MMGMPAPDFADWFEANRSRFVGLRRDLHAHPELGFEERRTAARLADHLREAGLELCEGIAKTGFVASLISGPGPILGLRADIDALPIQEKAMRPHISRHAGVMHACGHDGHATALLAAACYLAEQANQGGYTGNVRFIFQPAEENLGGAQAMIDDGLFSRFPVDRIFALHNMPGLDLGKFQTRPGEMMAGFDTFDIVLRAKGGHAGLPAPDGDAIVAACALGQQIQGIISRRLSSNERAVLALTRLEGGTAYNVLPHEVRMGGSVRWFNPGVRDRIREGISRIVQGIEISQGVLAEIDYREVYPALLNTPAEVVFAAGVAESLPGCTVQSSMEPVSGSEDFAFMLGQVAGAYLLFGNGRNDGESGLHGNSYDFNDDALPVAAGFWVALARSFALRSDLDA